MEKLVHLVSFIIRIFYDARSPERQILSYVRIPWRTEVRNSHSQEFRCVFLGI